jgi:hypothetical protein
VSAWWPRRARLVLVGAAALVAAGLLLSWPVTTRQGVNYEVTTHRLPLYLKAFEFLDRSAQYRQIAEEVSANASTDEQRAMAILTWTKRRVRDQPEGLPVVDDHILNIIIRGYGMPDQQADVYATLCTYAGLPAFWTAVKTPDQSRGRVLTFVEANRRWRLVDVAAGVAFRTPQGDLATFDEVQHHPELIPAAAATIDLGGLTYSDLMKRLAAPPVPHPLRAELQMPVPRLWHELKATVGIETRHEPE